MESWEGNREELEEELNRRERKQRADSQISDWDTGRKIASGTHTKTWKAVKGAKL